MWQCPDCGSPDSVQVLVSVWARIVQPVHDREEFETDIDGQDHDFDGNSGARCDSCGRSGNLDEFEVEGGDELPPDPEEMNDQRAAWAEAAVGAFNVSTGTMVERARAAVSAFREVCATDEEDAVKDLVCDIRHLCDRWDLDFEGALSGAWVSSVGSLLAGLRELSGEEWGAIMLTAEVNYAAETTEEEGEGDGGN